MLGINRFFCVEETEHGSEPQTPSEKKGEKRTKLTGTSWVLDLAG